MKGLICSILEPKDIGNCSAHGISSRVRKVTLVGPGIAGIFEPSEDAPAVALKELRISEDRLHVFARPIEIPEGAHSMMGGCFIWTSDSRFPSRQPIPLHDRVEVGNGYAD